MWPRSLLLASFLFLTGAARALPDGVRDSTGIPARGKPAGRPGLPLRIDMGVPERSTHGAVTCGADTHNPGFAWAYGMVREGDRPTEPDTWYGDFVEGEDATFLIAVEPAESTFAVDLSLGDAGLARGPVTILVNDRPVAERVLTKPGERRDVHAETATLNGWIEIRFRSDSCAGFALNGVVVTGPRGSWLGELFPVALQGEVIPPPETLPRLDEQGTLRLLRDICDHLVRFAPRQGGFSYHGAWYQNAYPVRTLLAAGRILGEPRYTEPALLCLDRFQARQLPDGNWLSTYYGSAACDTAAEPDTSSANLADIGTMALCLSLAAPLAGPERSDAYLRAARRYADRISLPNQLPDGAFPNGRWAGKHLVFPYTVATATQAASLAALAGATGDARYLEAAEKAARWLVAAVQPDGSFVLHPHDKAATVLKEADDFGDFFYVAEALTWVRAATSDPALRKEIDVALDRWLFGPRGLKSKTVNGYWFLPQDPWGSSKMAGLPYILANHVRRKEDPAHAAWLEEILAWMSDPGRSRRIGVMEHPGGPRGAYTLAATGFAGIGVAAALDASSHGPGDR